VIINQPRYKLLYTYISFTKQWYCLVSYRLAPNSWDWSVSSHKLPYIDFIYLGIVANESIKRHYSGQTLLDPHTNVCESLHRPCSPPKFPRWTITKNIINFYLPFTCVTAGATKRQMKYQVHYISSQRLQPGKRINPLQFWYYTVTQTKQRKKWKHTREVQQRPACCPLNHYCS
jgi:hypothetical protein